MSKKKVKKKKNIRYVISTAQARRLCASRVPLPIGMPQHWNNYDRACYCLYETDRGTFRTTKRQYIKLVAQVFFKVGEGNLGVLRELKARRLM